MSIGECGCSLGLNECNCCGTRSESVGAEFELQPLERFYELGWLAVPVVGVCILVGLVLAGVFA